jgi:hypothetical protein
MRRESALPDVHQSWNYLHSVQVGSEAPGYTLEARLRSTNSNSEDLSDLGERQIENEIEMQEQPIPVWKALDRLLEIESGVHVLVGSPTCGGIFEADNRPPPLAKRHPALVRDDGEKPRPDSA